MTRQPHFTLDRPATQNKYFRDKLRNTSSQHNVWRKCVIKENKDVERDDNSLTASLKKVSDNSEICLEPAEITHIREGLSHNQLKRLFYCRVNAKVRVQIS